MSNTHDFKPFPTGCGLCKPSTDYYKIQMGGVGNYSKDGLIPQSNGKNFYLDNKIPNAVKSNCYYETANGGSNKSKNKKKLKKVKGGFFDMQQFHSLSLK